MPLVEEKKELLAITIHLVKQTLPVNMYSENTICMKATICQFLSMFLQSTSTGIIFKLIYGIWACEGQINTPAFQLASEATHYAVLSSGSDHPAKMFFKKAFTAQYHQLDH